MKNLLPLLLLALVGSAPASSPSHPPVVLELFTSQGCSSCPPADALLERLAADPTLDLIPLAFHVDYWDRLGWKDPYSQSAWSARQNRYAALFNKDSVYTPQVVVDGREQMVGSDERAIRNALQRRRSTQAVRTAISSMTRHGASLRVSVEAEVTADAAREIDLVVVLFEHGPRTAVGAGENRGRQLPNPFIVRELRGFRMAGKKGSRWQTTVDLAAPQAWRSLGIALLASDAKTAQILGATRRAS